jgi:hypothetical protein
VVDVWLESGDDDSVELVLDRMRARLASERSTALARATEALLRARLLLARGENGDAARAAARALEELGDNAPWLRSKAIRGLQRAGAASEELLEEARTIEASLGTPSIAVAP